MHNPTRKDITVMEKDCTVRVPEVVDGWHNELLLYIYTESSNELCYLS